MTWTSCTSIALYKSLLSLAFLLVPVNGNSIGSVHQIRSGLALARTNTVLPEAQFTVPFSASVPRSEAKKQRLNALRDSVATGTSNFTTPAAGTTFDQEYVANVTIGGQTFALRIDTGSSDTWVPREGFSCFNLSGYPVPASTCAFGTAGFNTSASSTYSLIPDINFNQTYGSGDFVNGNMAYETVTIGGMVVPHQEIGIVTKAAWQGDGVNSGVLGLASPNLTVAYNGTNPEVDEPFKTQIPYNPVFYTAVQEGVVSEPYFSLALNRGSLSEAENNSIYDPNLGYLAFGGIAPVPVTNTSVTVPLQGYSIGNGPSNGTNITYLYYNIDVETMSFSGNTEIFGTTNDIILDSGTAVNYVPADVADAFAAAFDPPATFWEEIGLYFTLCNATVPEFTVKIGGTTFTVDPADNLLPAPGLNDSEGNPLCASGTSTGGPVDFKTIYILGDTFLHNVVTTFNIQTDEVTITQREPYSSSSSSRRALRRSL